MCKKTKKYIPLEECEDGKIYKILSRNLTYGMFDKDTKGFTGLRTKFNDIFLFEEYHWDADTSYGTVKPLEILDYAPVNKNDKNALKILLYEIEYKKFKTTKFRTSA